MCCRRRDEPRHRQAAPSWRIPRPRRQWSSARSRDRPVRLSAGDPRPRGGGGPRASPSSAASPPGSWFAYAAAIARGYTANDGQPHAQPGVKKQRISTQNSGDAPGLALGQVAFSRTGRHDSALCKASSRPPPPALSRVLIAPHRPSAWRHSSARPSLPAKLAIWSVCGHNAPADPVAQQDRATVS